MESEDARLVNALQRIAALEKRVEKLEREAPSARAVPAELCSACSGTGYRNAWLRIQCEACNGLGWESRS